MRADRATKIAIAKTIVVIEIYEKALQEIADPSTREGQIAENALKEAQEYFDQNFGDNDA